MATLTESTKRLEDEKITDAVVAFLVEAPAEATPPAAAEAAKRVILDTIGVALAASHRPIGRILAASAPEETGGKSATILGAARRTAANEAARANATMANALDFDEGFHLATHIVPTALAIAERERLSGAQMLDGVAIAYEFGAKLTHAIDFRRRDRVGPTARGFWHVGMVGPLAAAAAAARLTRLEAEKTRTALGIASCSSGGFRRNMGTMSKALHSGNAARAGIEAVDLARRGFTADRNILEAPLGFLAALCAPDERDTSALFKLGAPHALETLRNTKAFPACTPGHALIDAALSIQARVAPRLEAIESIEADLHTFSLLRDNPDEEDALGFSGAYLIAAALIHGAFGLDQISEEAVHDPRVRGLMIRIKQAPGEKAGVDRVRVRFRDGSVVDGEAPSRPRRLVAQKDIEAKFLSCAGSAVGSEKARRLLDLIGALERQPNLDEIMRAAGGY